MNKKVYIAASFAYEDKAKTSQRKDQIEKTVKRIKKLLGKEYSFYIPHQLKIPNAWDISLEEWSKAVYNHDVKALSDANLIIFLSYGKENNAGSVWECGWVAGYNTLVSQLPVEPDDIKKIIMIKMTDQIESLMLFGSIDTIIMDSEIESYDWKNLPAYKTPLAKLS